MSIHATLPHQHRVERHLILVNKPDRQAVGDFEEIKQRIERLASDIEVFIASTANRHSVLRRNAAKRPSLIVSPTKLETFVPMRGKICQGQLVPKDTQIRRLRDVGIRVPLTEVLGPETKLDPAVWGPVLLLKPLAHGWTSSGAGMSLVATDQLRYRKPEDYPANHPGRHSPFLVKRFIDTGPYVGSYRVNSLFGDALYCMYIELAEPRIDLSNQSPSETVATNSSTVTTGRRWMAKDPDVLDLARRCQAAFPDIPLMGVDILREVATGNLYVLELNLGGNTWHISSKSYNKYRVNEITRDRMVSQFSAWDVAAKVLIAQTRMHAV